MLTELFPNLDPADAEVKGVDATQELRLWSVVFCTRFMVTACRGQEGHDRAVLGRACALPIPGTPSPPQSWPRRADLG